MNGPSIDATNFESAHVNAWISLPVSYPEGTTNPPAVPNISLSVLALRAATNDLELDPSGFALIEVTVDTPQPLSPDQRDAELNALAQELRLNGVDWTVQQSAFVLVKSTSRFPAALSFVHRTSPHLAGLLRVNLSTSRQRVVIRAPLGSDATPAEIAIHTSRGSAIARPVFRSAARAFWDEARPPEGQRRRS